MEIKLAKDSLKAEMQSITTDEMAKIVLESNKKDVIFYLAKENPEKDIKKVETFFKNKKYAVFTRELRYGLDSKDYIYELHVI